MLMSFVYHRFHADRELSLLAGHAHPVGIDTANFTPLAMSVSRRECLQAGCNDCEFIGNEREQSVRLIGNESEQRNAIFASSPDYVWASIMGSATLCFSRWTQRRGRQLHRVQNRRKHRARLLTEKALRCRCPVRPGEEMEVVLSLRAQRA